MSTPSHQFTAAAELIRRLNWPRVHLFGVPNRGRDFAPFVLQLLPTIIEMGHEYVLKLHTKATKHLNFGQAWGHHMVSSLLSPSLLDHFFESPELGVMTPQGTLLPMSVNLAENLTGLQCLKALSTVLQPSLLDCYFPGGSMFMARTDALHPLVNLGLNLDDFEFEAGQVDGTLSHALERWVGVAAQSQGYQQAQVPGDERMVPDFGFRRAEKTVPRMHTSIIEMPHL